MTPGAKGELDFGRDTPPPIHMAITYGPIEAAPKKKSSTSKKAKAKAASANDDNDLSEEVGLLFYPFTRCTLEQRSIKTT